MRFRFFLKILLLLSANFAIFSEDFLVGNALSSSVEKMLSEKGFSPIQQELSQTGQDDFAYNLILNFDGNTEKTEEDGHAEFISASQKEGFRNKFGMTDENQKNGFGMTDENQNLRDEVIFAFTQEDFSKNQSEILDFLAFLKDLKRSWRATVLFLPSTTRNSKTDFL